MTHIVDVDTRHGPARWHVDPAVGAVRATLALGHGAGGGVEASDLVVVSRELAANGVTVARFEQPWRVEGRRVAGPKGQLDGAFIDAVGSLPPREHPLVVGGRSAGARVACRTADRLDAVAVLALAFPLHPPGRPAVSRADELPENLPVLVVQGSRDPFGSPDDVRVAALPTAIEVVAVAGADHSLRVSAKGPITQREADEVLAIGVRRWLLAAPLGNLR